MVDKIDQLKQAQASLTICISVLEDSEKSLVTVSGVATVLSSIATIVDNVQRELAAYALEPEEPDVVDDFPIELEYGVPGVNAPFDGYDRDEDRFGRDA